MRLETITMNTNTITPNTALVPTVYFKPTLAILEAIERGDILDLTPNKHYPILRYENRNLVFIHDDVGATLLVRVVDRCSNIHLNNLGGFLHSYSHLPLPDYSQLVPLETKLAIRNKPYTYRSYVKNLTPEQYAILANVSAAFHTQSVALRIRMELIYIWLFSKDFCITPEASTLIESFYWGSSRQGSKYWAKVDLILSSYLTKQQKTQGDNQ